MRRFDYEIGENGWLKTNCPFVEDGNTKIASLSCQNCEGFIEDDEESQIVKCEFDEILEERES